MGACVSTPLGGRYGAPSYLAISELSDLSLYEVRIHPHISFCFQILSPGRGTWWLFVIHIEDSAHRVLGDSLRKRKNFQVQLFVQLEKKGLYWLLSLFSSRVVNLCSKPVWDWLHWTRVNCGPNSQELFLLPPCTCAVYSYIANGWKGIGAMW